MSFCQFEKPKKYFCVTCQTFLSENSFLRMHLSLPPKIHEIEKVLTIDKSKKENFLQIIGFMNIQYRKIINNKCSHIIQNILELNQIVMKNCFDLTNDLQSFLNKKFFHSNELQHLEKLLTWELVINPDILNWLEIKSHDDLKKNVSLNNSFNLYKSLKIRKFCTCHEKPIKSLSQLKNHSPCLILSYYMFNQTQNSKFYEIISKKLLLIQELKTKIFEKLRKIQNFGKSFKLFHNNLNEFTVLANSEILYINQVKKLENLYDLLLDENKTTKVILSLDKKIIKLSKIQEMLIKQIFELKEPENHLRFKVLTHFFGNISCICCDELKRKIFLGSENATIRCVKLEKCEQSYVLIGHASCVKSMVLLNNSKKLISSSDDLTIRIWDLKTYSNSILISDLTCLVKKLSVSIDENYLALDRSDGVTIIFDITNNTIYKSFKINKTKSSKFLNCGKLLVQFSDYVSLYQIENQSNKKIKHNVYRSIISDNHKFILLISKSNTKCSISKFIISSGNIEEIISTNESISKAYLINQSKNALLIIEKSMALLDIKKRILTPVSISGLHIPSLKLFRPKNNFTIIAIYKKSKILMINLQKPDFYPLILTNSIYFNESKIQKLENFIYSPAFNSIISLDLNTNLISFTKLPFKPSIFKFISRPNSFISISKNRIYSVSLNPLKILFEFQLKDKVSSLAIKHSSNLIAAGYKDSHHDLSYIQVINFSGKFVKCIKTNTKEKIKFIIFQNSSENFITASEKGKITLWNFLLSNQIHIINSKISSPIRLSLSTNDQYLYIISKEKELLQLDTKSYKEKALDMNDSKQKLQSDLTIDSYESLIFSFII